jgi:hypothetical protein
MMCSMPCCPRKLPCHLDTVCLTLHAPSRRSGRSGNNAFGCRENTAATCWRLCQQPATLDICGMSCMSMHPSWGCGSTCWISCIRLGNEAECLPESISHQKGRLIQASSAAGACTQRACEAGGLAQLVARSATTHTLPCASCSSVLGHV